MHWPVLTFNFKWEKFSNFSVRFCTTVPIFRPYCFKNEHMIFFRQYFCQQLVISEVGKIVFIVLLTRSHSCSDNAHHYLLCHEFIYILHVNCFNLLSTKYFNESIFKLSQTYVFYDQDNFFLVLGILCVGHLYKHVCNMCFFSFSYICYSSSRSCVKKKACDQLIINSWGLEFCL